MLAGLVAVQMALAGVTFDMTPLLALMYPGRERVEISTPDGRTIVYACKLGPAGETAQEQGAKAQAAFEENVAAFSEVFIGEMMSGIDEDKPSLATGFELNRKMQSWAGANFTHLEKEYGCALLGES